MATEQEKTLKALRTAVQMEIDGKEYYIRTSQACTNKLGAKLLRSLSQAEDAHRQKFIDLYGVIRDKKSWPRTDLKPGAGKSLENVFSTATRKMADATKPLASELDALQTAMKMENKTVDFYGSQLARATSDTEKGFYKAIIAEEREHHMVLQSYYEFLQDPSGWFLRSERQSVDGG